MKKYSVVNCYGDVSGHDLNRYNAEKNCLEMMKEFPEQEWEVIPLEIEQSVVRAKRWNKIKNNSIEADYILESSPIPEKLLMDVFN